MPRDLVRGERTVACVWLWIEVVEVAGLLVERGTQYTENWGMKQKDIQLHDAQACGG